jgi:hypothetical protein
LANSVLTDCDKASGDAGSCRAAQFTGRECAGFGLTGFGEPEAFSAFRERHHPDHGADHPLPTPAVSGFPGNSAALHRPHANNCKKQLILIEIRALL